MSSDNRTPFAIIVGSLFIAGAILGGFYLLKQQGPSQPTSITEEAEEVAAKPEKTEPKVVSAKDQFDTVSNYKKVSKDDHIRGNPDAKISIIEYSDFECPFCKRFHPTAQEVMDKYDGKVNWVYRHFPLSFHDPLATKQAEATECVAELGGNDKFWEYADKIYETTTSNGSGMELEQLSELAVEVGVNKSKFDTCLESGKYSEKVQQDLAEGEQAGVSGTPGNIVVNNETGDAYAVTGAQPFSRFKLLINDLL